MTVDTGSASRERRAAVREAIHRPVVFAGVRGEGLLRQGIALDISANGLLIHTTQPDLVGRHLELELHPNGAAGPGEVVMVRGEIAWVKPLPQKGEHAMGVRFLASIPATEVTGARYEAAGKKEAAELAASIQRRLKEMEPAARVEISDTARKKSEAAQDVIPVRVVSDPGPKKRRRRSRLLVLLLLLLVMAGLGLLLAFGVIWALDRPVTVPVSPAGSQSELPELPTEPAVFPISAIVGEKLDAMREQGASYFVSRGSLLLAQQQYPAAARAFQAAQREPHVTPTERYLAELGEAESWVGSGDRAAALAILERPFDEREFVPELWRVLREHYRDALRDNATSDAPVPPLVYAFDIGPGTDAGDDIARESNQGRGGPETEGAVQDLRIEIDTTNYLLTVLQDNAIRAVYPVGLGARGFTPEGVYRIINKIKNPDWYNRGDVVPAGNPENQLGSRWLGLADGERAIPIGIHATDALDSIGRNESRGCIRMRPEDVEALFEYVTVGTPVHIRAL